MQGLMVHTGGTFRTRDELATLETPDATESWKPVPHWELIESLHEGLAGAGIAVERERYATSGRLDARIFGVLDLIVPDLDTPDYRMALGIRGANDKSMAIQAVAGARVFVCDNMAFSGDSGTVVLKKKHTCRLDLGKVVPPAIDLYLEKAGAFKLDLERMREEIIPDGRAKEIIFDAFLGPRPVSKRALMKIVADLYFKDEEQREKFPDRSVWSLNNAFTEAAKRLKAAPQERTLIQVGRTFGRLMHQDRPRMLDFDPAVADADVELPAVN